MKCKDFEREIYLYRELTIPEREIIDAHIKDCDACRDFFARVQQTEVLVSKTTSVTPQPQNFSRLTGNIMQAIGAERERKQSVSWINNPFFRYAMVAASLFLLVAFAYEQQTSIDRPKSHITQTVRLTSKPVGKIITRKEKTAPLYSSIRNEAHTTILIENITQKRF